MQEENEWLFLSSVMEINPPTYLKMHSVVGTDSSSRDEETALAIHVACKLNKQLHRPINWQRSVMEPGHSDSAKMFPGTDSLSVLRWRSRLERLRAPRMCRTCRRPPFVSDHLCTVHTVALHFVWRRELLYGCQEACLTPNVSMRWCGNAVGSNALLMIDFVSPWWSS